MSRAYKRARPADIGFHTGNPRVGFSHTVPEPAEPVPATGGYPYRTVNYAVWYETRGTAHTRGCIIFCHSSNLTKAAGTSIDVHRAFREVIR
jgi:hypothetical protein